MEVTSKQTASCGVNEVGSYVRGNFSGEQSGQGDPSKTANSIWKKDSFGNTVDLTIQCLVKDCQRREKT